MLATFKELAMQQWPVFSWWGFARSVYRWRLIAASREPH